MGIHLWLHSLIDPSASWNLDCQTATSSVFGVLTKLVTTHYHLSTGSWRWWILKGRVGTITVANALGEWWWFRESRLKKALFFGKIDDPFSGDDVGLLSHCWSGEVCSAVALCPIHSTLSSTHGGIEKKKTSRIPAENKWFEMVWWDILLVHNIT